MWLCFLILLWAGRDSNPHFTRKLVPKTSVYTIPPPARIFLSQLSLGYPRGLTEYREDMCYFFFEGSIIFIFTVMSCGFSVGMFLLIEMKRECELHSFDGGIAMKTRVSTLRERTNEAHLFTFLSLKTIPETTK